MKPGPNLAHAPRIAGSRRIAGGRQLQHFDALAERRPWTIELVRRPGRRDEPDLIELRLNLVLASVDALDRARAAR